MAGTVTATPTRGNGQQAHRAVPVQPRQRRVSWVVLGVLMVAGSALGFAAWATSIGDRAAVLVAARDIEAGTAIDAADLRTVRLAVDGDVGWIAAGDEAAVVGRVAAVRIPAGTLLHGAQLAGDSLVAAGDAVVGVLLAPGAIPVPELRAGDVVAVVATSAGLTADVAGQATTGILSTARVFAVAAHDDGQGSTAVSLLVPEADAPAVADAAGADRVRLVLLSPERAS